MQPAEVGLGQPLDYAVTGFGQSDANHTAVVAVRYPLDQPGRLSPVDELHSAMRAQQQVAGEVAHSRRLLFRVSLYRHQQLVLYMGKGRRFSLVLAPALEFAQSDPEFQQSLEIPPGHPRHRHLHNLSSMPRTAGNFRQHARGRCRKCLRHSIGKPGPLVMRTLPAHLHSAARPAGRWHITTAFGALAAAGRIRA